MRAAVDAQIPVLCSGWLLAAASFCAAAEGRGQPGTGIWRVNSALACRDLKNVRAAVVCCSQLLVGEPWVCVFCARTVSAEHRSRARFEPLLKRVGNLRERLLVLDANRFDQSVYDDGSGMFLTDGWIADRTIALCADMCSRRCAGVSFLSCAIDSLRHWARSVCSARSSEAQGGRCACPLVAVALGSWCSRAWASPRHCVRCLQARPAALHRLGIWKST